MTSSILGGFFQQTGGKSISWKGAQIGTRQGDVIKALNPPEPQTEMKPPHDPIIDKKTGRPKMQVRIDLNTTYKDPSDPDDDGSRSLYVKGWMTGAVGDALRKAGVTDPEVGGTLFVTLSEQTPNDTPGWDPINKFTAEYTPPAKTAGYFSEQPGGAAQVTQQAAPAAPAAAAVQQEPQRPAAIAEDAWAGMDLSTKIAVANTMGGGDKPPF